MMHPVSLEVVRQATRWMGIPPISALHQSRQLLNAHGTLSVEYLAYFDPFEVSDYLAYWEVRNTAELPEFTAALNECFCDDIHVVGSYYSAGHNKVIATFVILPFVAGIE